MMFLCWLNLAFSSPQIPSDIAEWIDWVADQHPQGNCIDRKYENCQWLGQLTLHLQSDEGRFLLQGEQYAPGWVPLPGSTDLWPVNVRLNERHVPVLEQNGQPQIYVPTGPVNINGFIVWNAIPNELPLPKSVGLIEATINNTSIDLQLDEKGRLLLEEDTAISITPPILTVSRLWSDGPTPTLTTHISIQNASKSQRIDLGSILLQDGFLIQTSGSVSHWVDENDHVFVYAPSGIHHFQYVHALEPQLNTIPIPATPSDWPSIEHWAVDSNIAHRQINITGLRPVSTTQSETPETWHLYPTYIKDSSANPEFDVLLRGNPSPPANTLHQYRQIWPKLNGTGFWIQDKISGTMNQDWRLQPPSSLNIQSIEQSNFAQSIVEQAGIVEIPVRSKNVDVSVISDTSENTLPNEVWNTTFSSTETILWMPKNWTLLYWDGWIWNNLMGAIINFGLALLLAWQRRTEPLLNLPIVLGATVGGLIAPLSTLAWLCINWLCLRFNKSHWMFILSVGWGAFALNESRPSDARQPTSIHMAERYSSLAYEDASMNNAKMAERSFYTQNNTQTIQMGIGLPTWQGNPTRKSWQDDQMPSEPMSIWVLKTHQKRWLAIIAGLLIIGLGWFRTNSRTVIKTAIILGLFGLAGSPQDAFAQTPSTSGQVLPSKEIEGLLVEHLFPDTCKTDCLNIALSKLSINENTDKLSIWMEVHAIEDAVLTLPGPIAQWSIESVIIEGQPTYAMRTSAKGFLEVYIPKGIWSIDATGPINDGLQLQWPMVPHRTDTETGNWIVQGMLENGQIEQTIGFRPSQSEVTVHTKRHTGLIEWIQEVQLDSQWKIVNTLTRDLKNDNSALSIPLPLPPNVQLLSPHAIATEDGWRIEFPKNQSSISWTTVHPIEDQLTLEYTTLKNIPTSLTWRVQCGNTLHCNFEGPPPTTHTDALDQWIPTWHPYPDETLRIKATPLTSKPGETTQVQSLLLEHHVNTAWIHSTAKLTLKSSASQPIKFTVPEKATVTTVYMNGEAYPFQPNQSLTLLTNIGTNTVDVSWKLKSEGRKHTLPGPGLDLGISNPTIKVHHDKDTTIVWGSNFWSHNSPPFWSTLILLVLMALGLARHPNSKRQFSLWIATLLGIAHVGWTLGAVLLPLLVLQHLSERSRLTILIELCILPILFLSLVRLLVNPTFSVWLWEGSHLQWYADFVTDIPTVEVISIPVTWTMIPWSIWILWMLFELLPSLFKDSTELMTASMNRKSKDTTEAPPTSE